MATDALEINVLIVEKAREIFSALAEIRPEKSFSFILTEEGIDLRLADDGLGHF